MSWTDLIPTAFNTATSLFNTDEKSKAAKRATGQIVGGIRQSADTLNQGYDDRLANDTATIAQLRGLASSQAGETSMGWQSLPPQLQQQLAQAARQYGTSIDQMWGRLSAALQPAAQQYGHALQADAGSYADAVGGGAQGYGAALGHDAGTYAGGMIRAARDYGDNTNSVAGSYAGGLGAAGDRYAGSLGSAADAYSGGLTSAIDRMYAPYAAAGAGALQQIRAIAAANPGQLTPIQQQALDDYQRSMRTNLAASGLSGAGMAGLAAFNRGDAEMRAQLIQQNQARSDQALYALQNAGLAGTGAMAGAAGQGFGARLQAAQMGAGTQLGQANTGLGAQYGTGQANAQTLLGAINTGLGAVRGAGDAGAGAAYQAGLTGAGALRQAGDAAAQAGYQTANTLGMYGYQGGLTGANALYNAGNQAANYASRIGEVNVQNLDNFYRNLGTLASAQGQATDTDIWGKAQTNATAQQAIANTQAGLTNTDSNLWGSAISTLGGALSRTAKTAFSPPPPPNGAPSP